VLVYNSVSHYTTSAKGALTPRDGQRVSFCGVALGGKSETSCPTTHNFADAAGDTYVTLPSPADAYGQ